MDTGARVVGSVAIAATAVALAGARPAPAPPPVAVGYASLPALRQALAGSRARLVRTVAPLRVAEVVPAGAPDAFARTLRALPGIRFVEPVSARTAASEPALAAGTAGVAYEWQFAAAREDAVPEAVLRAASAVTIAVVDTGADLTAPDLAAKAPLAHSTAADSDEVVDTSGHGTFVASLAAGSVSNGDGIAGFGGDARLIVVQANERGDSFTDLDEARAIAWAVEHGARIVNLSIGGSTTSRVERDAIAYAVRSGVLVVAAAGNEYGDGDRPQYPAALLQPPDSDGIGGAGLSVGASGPDGRRAPFSNTGGTVSLVAPGVDVLGAVSSLSSAAEYPRFPLPGAVAGLYGFGSGSSYATPQVAGAAALVWAANPLLTAAQVAQVLKETASNRGVWNPETGWGVVDAAAAVARATAGPVATASVSLRGDRAGARVRLRWSGRGAAAYRLSVSRDGAAARTLLSGPETAASYALAPGHVYVFRVDAVDAGGFALARSAPYRVAQPATRSIRAPSSRKRSSMRS